MAKESQNIEDEGASVVNDAFSPEEQPKLTLGQLLQRKLDLYELDQQKSNTDKPVESQTVVTADEVSKDILNTEKEKENVINDSPAPAKLEGRLPNSEEPLFPEDSENRELIREDIQQMKEPARRILEQIRAQIENGEYQLLIGDDVSGRLPTLLFREIINGIYREKGRDEIPTRFIAGTAHYGDSSSYGNEREQEKKTTISELIVKTREEISTLNKVLILTDAIESGRSLQPVVEVLNEMGINFDIASLALMEDPEKNPEKEDFTTRLGKNVILGGMTELPKIYRNDYSGLTKNTWYIHSYHPSLTPSSYYYQWCNAPQPVGFVSEEFYLSSDEIEKLSDEDKQRYYAPQQKDPRVQEHLRLRMRIAREELHTIAEELLKDIKAEHLN